MLNLFSLVGGRFPVRGVLTEINLLILKPGVNLLKPGMDLAKTGKHNNHVIIERSAYMYDFVTNKSPLNTYF